MNSTLTPEPGPATRPTRRRLTAVVIGLVIVVGAGAAIAAGLAARQTNGDSAAPAAVAVHTSVAELRDIVDTSRITGSLTPALTLNLNAKVSGVVARVPVEMGQAVSKGTVLLELSGSDLRPQVDVAAAALEAAQANLARVEKGASWEDLQSLQATVTQATTAWEQAVSNYERMSYLYSQGAVPRLQFEAAEAQVKVANAQLSAAQMQVQKAQKGADEETRTAARAQVSQAEASHKAAVARLEDTILRAPAAGIVSYVKVSPGELTAPGAPQIGLVDTRTLYLEAALTESVVSSIAEGQELVIKVPSLDQSLPGRVDQVAPAADPRTRMFAVRIQLDNKSGALRAGMTGEVEITTSQLAGVLTVPRQAVVVAGQDSAVFVVSESIARRRTVTTGATNGDLIVILTGLEPGEVVVTTGAGLLRDGALVNILGGR